MFSYDDPLAPQFSGTYVNSNGSFDGTVRVVSWNIKFAQEIGHAVHTLGTVGELAGADILLLQEMDEHGADAIAQSLGYNYVYFPAVVHSYHERNFGNAILAKWPIGQTRKVMLPHQNPRNRQIRIATQALIMAGDLEILASCVHTETYWLPPSKRGEQIDMLAADLLDMPDYVVVGGDFNTLTRASITDLERRVGRAGLQRISQGAGYTYQAGMLKFTMDHIFARYMYPVEKGVWRDTQASDHFPLWVRVSPLRTG